VTSITIRGYCDECRTPGPVMAIWSGDDDDRSYGICESCLENALTALRESAATGDKT